MSLDLRHPLEGTPLLAPHLLDILPFSAVFQCNSERLELERGQFLPFRILLRATLTMTS